MSDVLEESSRPGCEERDPSSSRQQVSALCLHIVTCAETEILPQLSQPAAKNKQELF